MTFPFSILITLSLCILCWVLTRKNSRLPYVAREYLLTYSELQFYRSLLLVADHNNLTVMSKVRLWDIIEVEKGTKNIFTYQNKISSKHIDFVLCNSGNLKPLLAIELDDKSHERKDRQEADRYKNNALKSAGVPLLRIPVQRNYEIHHLEQMILSKINKS